MFCDSLCGVVGNVVAQEEGTWSEPLVVVVSGQTITRVGDNSGPFAS